MGKIKSSEVQATTALHPSEMETRANHDKCWSDSYNCLLPVPFNDTDRGRVVGMAIKVMQVSNEHGRASCPHFPKNILC